MRGKTLAFTRRIAIIFCDLKTSLGARACVYGACVQKTRRCAFAFLNPLLRRQVGDGMGGGRNGRFGAPRCCQDPGKHSIFHKKMQNRGAPETAVPTTHPIPHLTPSESHPLESMWRPLKTTFDMTTLIFSAGGAPRTFLFL